MVTGRAQAQPQPAAPVAAPANGATALATRGDKLATFRDFLVKYRPQLSAVLGKTMSVERLIQVTMAAIGRDEKLQRCTPVSVVRSVMVAAQVGLDPSGVLGSAYLVPFWNKHINAYEAQLVIGYRGLLDLARRAGDVVHVEARCVYEKDRFEYELGTEPRLLHIPSLDENPGKIIAAYSIITLRNSDKPLIEVMPRGEIQRIRRRSKAADEGPWITDEDMMSRKTVLRRGIRYVPMSPEAAQAVSIEERMEAGEDLANIFPLPVDEAPRLPASKSEELAQRIKEARQATQAAAAAPLPEPIPQEEAPPEVVQETPPPEPETTAPPSWVDRLEELLAQVAPVPQARPGVLYAATSFERDGKRHEGFRSLDALRKSAHAEAIAEIACKRLEEFASAVPAKQERLV